MPSVCAGCAARDRRHRRRAPTPRPSRDGIVLGEIAHLEQRRHGTGFQQAASCEGRQRRERRHHGGASGSARGQRGVKGQPAPRWPGGGTRPGMAGSRSPLRREPRRCREEARAYRDGAAAPSTEAAAPRSAMRPAYITTIWLHSSAATPRSWVMSRMDKSGVALQRAQQRDDLRLDGHIERGRRLVGDQELRPADERHGDHDALAQAARQLVRILLGAPFGVADADLAQHVDDARDAPPRRSCRDGAAEPRRSGARPAGSG